MLGVLASLHIFLREPPYPTTQFQTPRKMDIVVRSQMSLRGGGGYSEGAVPRLIALPRVGSIPMQLYKDVLSLQRSGAPDLKP